MKDADFYAAWQMAAEMTLFDGAKFLRLEIGWSLREAIQACEQIAREFPTSPLAASVAARAAVETPRPLPLQREEANRD